MRGRGGTYTFVLVVALGCRPEPTQSPPTAPTIDKPTTEPEAPRSFDTLALDAWGGCWVREDRRVVCVGTEIAGSLGWGAPGNPRWAPRVVPDLDGVVQLAGHIFHRCALTQSGQVHCFGPWRPHSGHVPQWREPPPRSARALETYKYRTRDDHHFALDGDGGLLWASPTPDGQTWTAVAGIEDGVELATVGTMVCARTRGGQVVCFEPSYPPVPVSIAGIVGAAELTTATDGTDQRPIHDPDGAILVRESDGTLHRLTRDPLEASPHAFRRDDTGLDDVVALDRACALRATGEVVCLAPLGELQALTGVPKARAHVATDHGVCILAEQDGAVHCKSSDAPWIALEHLSPARAIVRVDYDGDVCALGQDHHVRCVDKDYAARSLPELSAEMLATDGYEILALHRGQVWRLIARTSHIDRVPVDDAVGFEWFDNDQCIRRADGGLLCQRYGYVELSTKPVAGLPPVAEIALGDGFACARTERGEVRCWGVVGAEGQLGDGRAQPGLTPVEVVGIDDAVDIAASDRSACAVRASGTIECWGYLRDLESEIEFDIEAAPKPVPGFAGAVQVALLDDTWLCARHHDGTVSCMNSCRESRTGPSKADLRRVADLDGVVHLTSGNSFAGIVADNSVQTLASWWPNTSECTDDDPPTWLDLEGVRGVQLQPGWGCADLLGERGPTCWGLDMPAMLRGDASAEKPGQVFPFVP